MTFIDKIYEELKYVFEPEMGVNLVDLGLIYSVDIDEMNNAKITLSLLNKQSIFNEDICKGVKFAVLSIDGIRSVDVQLVWNPCWNPKMMKTELREQLIGS